MTQRWKGGTNKDIGRDIVRGLEGRERERGRESKVGEKGREKKYNGLKQQIY